MSPLIVMGRFSHTQPRLPMVLVRCEVCALTLAHQGRDLEEGGRVIADQLIEHMRRVHQRLEVSA